MLEREVPLRQPRDWERAAQESAARSWARRLEEPNHRIWQFTLRLYCLLVAAFAVLVFLVLTNTINA